MKRRLLLSLLSLLGLVASTSHAAAPASLHLKQKDIERVIIQMEPDKKTEVRISISKAKLSDFLSLTEANLNKPIPIYLDDKLITAPVITKLFVEKIRYLTLKFPDFDSAAQVAHAFMPAK